MLVNLTPALTQNKEILLRFDHFASEIITWLRFLLWARLQITFQVSWEAHSFPCKHIYPTAMCTNESEMMPKKMNVRKNKLAFFIWSLSDSIDFACFAYDLFLALIFLFISIKNETSMLDIKRIRWWIILFDGLQWNFSHFPIATLRWSASKIFRAVQKKSNFPKMRR